MVWDNFPWGSNKRSKLHTPLPWNLRYAAGIRPLQMKSKSIEFDIHDVILYLFLAKTYRELHDISFIFVYTVGVAIHRKYGMKLQWFQSVANSSFRNKFWLELRDK